MAGGDPFAVVVDLAVDQFQGDGPVGDRGEHALAMRAGAGLVSGIPALVEKLLGRAPSRPLMRSALEHSSRAVSELELETSDRWVPAVTAELDKIDLDGGGPRNAKPRQLADCLVAGLGLGVTGTAWISVPISVVWLWLGLALGREQRRRAALASAAKPGGAR